jgi:hypothetical protein
MDDEGAAAEVAAVLVEFVLVAALADSVEPRIAPPVSPTVTRPVDANSFGLVRMWSIRGT